MSLSISIESNIAQIRAKVRPVNMPGVKKVVGRAVANRLRQHFFTLNRERPNRLGGRRTNFYSQAARSVQQPEIQTDGVRVSINHVGLAQRLLGGTLHPVHSTYLTIPARAEAYGKRAREFNDLEILWGRRGPIALVQRNHTRLGRGKKGRPSEQGGGVFFWLVKSVTQNPDPTVLPSEADLGRDIGNAVTSYLQALQN